MSRRNLAGALTRRATFRQLQVFETVARLSSFTRAAEELHLAQPTVSIQLKKLAETVGYPLFEQVGNGVKLTDIGSEVHSICLEVFAALANLETKVAEIKGLRRGHLHLAVTSSAKYLAPHLLGRFCANYPNIDVSLKVTNRERLIDRIANFQDDLYMLGQPPAQLKVEAYPLIPNHLVPMAARDHPLVGLPNIPLKRLLAEPFIMREPGSGTRDAALRAFEDAHLKAPTIRMDFESNEAIKQAVVAGLGITILSLHSLVLEGTSGPIAILDVEGFPIKRHWNVAHNRGKRLSVVAQTFLEFVHQQGREIADNFDQEMRKLHQSRPAPKGKRDPV